MAAGKAQVTVRGRFPAGERVRLVPRNSDTFHPPGVAVSTAKVDKTSEVTFGGLDEGATFWVAAEIDGSWRSAAVTAKVPASPKLRMDRPTSEEAKPAQRERQVEPPDTKPSKGETMPAPHMRQQDVPKGTVQRSDTPLGQATPVEPDEFQPKVPQSAVKAGTVQRSDTPHGEATPIPPGELDVEPAPAQDDVKGLQLSDTPEGTATPQPRARSRRARTQTEKERDASVTKSAAPKKPGGAAKAAAKVRKPARKGAKR
jgi:hypothetical protein